MKNQRELFRAFISGIENTKCGNVFIEDKVLYSYGVHYTLAERYSNGIWVNDERYSSSTSKQHSKLISCLASEGYSFDEDTATWR